MFDPFINKEIPQNCGDILRILKRTDEKRNYHWYYECEFLKYPLRIFAVKGDILRGVVNNPQIEQVEFVEKIWPQHCGDSLKVLEKVKIENKYKKGQDISLFECEFINYPYKVLATKKNIIDGFVLNPEIERIEFIEKIWPQKYEESIKIIRKTEIKQNGEFLFECQFQKYPCKILAKKGNIKRGSIINPNLPWKSKENLEKYIKNNFKENPFIFEIAYSLNLSVSYINRIINKFGLKFLINSFDNYSSEENLLKKYIKSIYKGKIERYCGTKEENYLEIDIYLPELKKGIEYNGSIWHEEGNINNPFSKPMGYHQKKQELFAKKGIEILFIWDYEWFEDFPKRQIINEQTKQKISNFLGV